MANSAADTHREPGQSSVCASIGQEAGQRAPLGATVALTATLAVGLFVVVASAAVLVSAPGPQLLPLGPAHDQTLESALYVVGFAVILPLALLGAPRLADTIAGGPNGRGLSVLTAFLAATLTASVILARLLPGPSVVDALVMGGIWSIAAVGLLVRAQRPEPWRLLLGIADRAPYAWSMAGGLVVVTLLAFTSLGSMSPLALVVAAIVLAAVLVAFVICAGALPRLPRPWGLAIDVGLIAVLIWAIPDLVIIQPGNAAATLVERLNAPVVPADQSLWLGPANQVLAGDPVLVNVASQYGIAPIYLLAGWFELAPIGYGTFGFLDGVLYSLYFAAGYCVLRIAGVSRVLAAGTLALAVVVLVYNVQRPPGVSPQLGPFRFGLPMALILASVANARWSRFGRVARGALFAVVGLASIWALDAFVYVLFTFAAIVAVEASIRRGPGSFRWVARQAAMAVAACVVAQFLFMLLTLAFAGQLPDYGWYLAFVRAFLFGDVAKITFDFQPWSPGFPVGVAYAASAIGLVLLAVRRPDLVERNRTSLIALSGMTAYGIALFSYLVDRSLDLVVPYVSLPALLAGALWLSLLLRDEMVHVRLRAGALAFALAVAVLPATVAWSSIGDQFPRSPLGEAVPGGGSLSGAVHRLWHFPPLTPLAPRGEALLDHYMRGDQRVLIIVPPASQTEILMRSGRANELPFGDPLEDSYLGSRRLSALRAGVDRLQVGDRILTTVGGLKQRRGSPQEPLDVIDFANILANNPGALAPLQVAALRLINERFNLRIVHRDKGGLVIATLLPRSAGTGGSPT